MLEPVDPDLLADVIAQAIGVLARALGWLVADDDPKASTLFLDNPVDQRLFAGPGCLETDQFPLVLGTERSGDAQ